MNTNEVDINYVVCVRCSTFNHTPYIVDAMNGFCMQQTTFPFVCTIIDDASTDGEQEVIKKYLEEHFSLEDKTTVKEEETNDYCLTFARHNTNQNCFFAVYFLKYNHYSIRKFKAQYIKEWKLPIKYYAYCEGDDYWIDSNKLQKQVDYLDSHPECGMVYGDILQYIQNEKKTINKSWVKEATFKELLKTNYICTLTTCFRTDLLEEYKTEIPVQKSWLMGDYPLWLYIAYKSEIHFIKDIMGVYRRLDNSMSHSTNIQKTLRFHKNSIDICLFFANKYMPSEIPSIKKKGIHTYISIALEQNKALGKDVFILMKEYHVFSPKLFLLALFVQTQLGVSILNLQRKIRISFQKMFNVSHSS